MTPLVGHNGPVAAFRAALDAERLHHAWLLAGPKGVGKALFARMAATRMIADASDPPGTAPALEVEDEHPAVKLIKAGSHPDLRLVEREVWDKDRIVPKHERKGTEDVARNIRIAQIRDLNKSLGLRSAMSGRRAVIIDSVDDLEPGAANALLKNVEEPAAGVVFFLISHAPDRLLPTIRSRCRLLRFKPLGDDAMTSALGCALPDASGSEIAALVRSGQGAPGRALAQRGLDLDALDAAMAALVRDGDATNAARSALAQSLSLKAAQPRYEAFLSRAPSAIAAAACERRGPALAEALALWERAAALAGAARRLSLDPTSTVFELAGMLAALAPGEARRAA